MTPTLRKHSRPLRAAMTAVIVMAGVPAAFAAEEDLWPGIRAEVFGERAIAEDNGAVTLYTPERAEDAALVPISVRIPGSVAPRAKSMVLIIDRNPAPVAATFTFGDGFRTGPDVGERQLATRIRVDSFSKVRAVLETADGELHMSSRFVIGAGGCSAPSSKDAEAALAGLGKVQIKSLTDAVRGEGWREVQVMVKHPNFTGLQMDPISRGYVPARFVNDLRVSSAGALVFRMEGGISISENPHLRFSYGSAPGDVIEVEGQDTAGTIFSERFPASGS